MSNKNNFSLFPEMSALKSTLWELQGEFAQAKPELHEALEALAPQGQNRPLDELEAAAVSQLTEQAPPELTATIAQARTIYEQLDQLLSDADERAAVIRGERDEYTRDLVAAALEPNYLEIVRLAKEIPALGYGTEALELEHVMETRIGVMNILLNRTFEVWDLRPPLTVNGQAIIDFFTGMAERFAALVHVDAMLPAWDLTGAWMRRWDETKPELRAAVRAGVPIGQYVMAPPRNIDNYRKGNRIATLQLNFGRMASASVVGGLLPAGLELNARNGAVQVSDPARLFPGVFSDIQLEVVNDEGFDAVLDLGEIEFGLDFEASYTVFSPVNTDMVQQGDLLAYPTDPDGTLSGAQIVGGNYPPGIRFATRSGELTVHDPAKLVPGIYDLKILTRDVNGGETFHDIQIEFAAAVSVTVNYQANSPYTLPLSNDIALAKPSVSTGSILGAALLSGSLPGGAILQSDGIIAVNDSTQLTTGNFTLVISLTTSVGPVITATCDFTINSDSDPEEITASYLTDGNFTLPLDSGTILATLEVSSGTVTKVSIVQGNLPDGVEMKSDGNLVISDSKAIQPGQFAVVVSVSTAEGPTATASVTIVFQEESSSDTFAQYELTRTLSLPLTNDFLIATVEITPGEVIGAKLGEGEMAPGTVLQPNGDMMVENEKEVVAGQFSMQIEITSSEDAVLVIPLDFEIFDDSDK
ncbi:MAG: hypothetical protein AAF998_13125 [Bacteroidota bacterium]